MTYKTHIVLLDYLLSTINPGSTSPILDLACGTGRSGLNLAQRGITVVFADRSVSALAYVKQYLSDNKLPGHIWHIDLEQAGINPFAGQAFSSAICFRYLHRPLFPYLLNVVEPGGLVIYETFTTENRRFGHPNNPDFLLKADELNSLFLDWEIIHYYEGIQHQPDRAIAQIIARKPVARSGKSLPTITSPTSPSA